MIERVGLTKKMGDDFAISLLSCVQVDETMSSTVTSLSA